MPACQFHHWTYIRQWQFAEDTEIARANKVAAACDRVLGNANQTSGYVEEARASHRAKDQFLDPVQPFLFDDAAAHIEDQAGERDFYRANGLASVASDAEALRPGSGLDAVMEWCYHQADSAAIDIAEGMAADLGIGRADIGA